MTSLNKHQRETMVSQYCEFTGAIPNDANRLLKAHKWQMALAMDAFWSDPTAIRNAERAREQASPNLVPRLNALFDRYSGGKKNDTIEIDGTLQWCKDLGVEPEDPVMLAIAEMCKAEEMGSFVRKGWVEGWAKLRKDSIEGQRDAVTSLRTSLSSSIEVFKRVYDFAFTYSKPAESRSLPLDTAAPLWQLLLPVAPPSLFQPGSAFDPHTDSDTATASLERWVRYLTEENKGRAISKDIWSQFLDFAASMDADYSAFSADEAWPSLMDGFVEHDKSRRGNGTMEE